MSMDNKVPDIRFKGFSGEWETSMLSNLALFNPKSELPERFKYVDLESVKGTSLIGYSVESRESAPSRAQRLARMGDVFYQTVRPYQKNNYLFQLAEPDYVFSTGYAQLRPYFNGNYLLNLIQRDSFVKNVLDSCTGTSYPAINASVLATLEVNYPESGKEQTQIGSYFQKLDVLINQHQQKHDKLNNIKKAMLKKMFPKQGETIPEIRFKGFGGAWGKNILEDICDVRDGTHASPQYHKNGFPLVTSKNVKNGYINYDDVQYISKIDFDEINKRSKVDVNDILMGMIGTIGNIALIREASEFAIKNVALIKDKNLIYFLYIYYFLQSPTIIQQLEDSASGGTQKFISLSNVRCLLIYLPEREEQAAIGNYFQKLDTLINQHQQQITKLNNIKQACLSKMFV
ncbi:restriction endonuclease subunit S [Morganella morganii subsp. morganii]|uniref:restriction endonuclease subunit S n=1 Tax=Morganella morganii TaxID=582 RepID=UPI001BD9C90A|nr:restriction endonuclease subunit S [Morganella morganii]MBT0354370.1 restriction endonuclease subunit S [Morganella morganii subsp. morganii]WLV39751.1 restriction endonuclease subunit S [Morganella morganii]